MEEINITICKNCRAVFQKNRWMDEKSLGRLIGKRLYSEGYDDYVIKNLKEIHDSIEANEKQIPIEIFKKGNKKLLDLKISYKTCSVCERAKSGYYEGILQLRNRQNSRFDDILTKTLEKIEAEKDIFIAKSIETKDGIDLYISSNKYLLSLGKWLNSNQGGELKISRKLYSRSRKTSKEIFRVTVLVRLPDFSEGDIIKTDEKYVLVKSIRAKTITGVDIQSKKRIKISYSQPREIIRKDEIKNAVVARTKPYLEVIHPVNFQNTRVENPDTVEGDKIRVIEILKKLYQVPS